MRTLRNILGIFILVILFTGGVMAQDAPPPADAAALARASELGWIAARNMRMPELLLVLNEPTIKVFNPFNPTGVDSTREQMAADEVYFQSAYTFAFTEWMILTEGDMAGVYVYQEGDFVGEYFGTPPTNEHQAGSMVYIDRFVDGRLTETNTAWDQQGFLEKLGWATTDYPDFSVAPWGLTMGTTSSTPADHHAVLDTLYSAFCAGCTPAFADLYTADVKAHDYTQTLEGVPAVSEQISKLTQLAGLEVGSKKVVCEGDMCISYLTLNFTAGEEAKIMIWAAVYRFVDGKIAEEWWQYDNSVLWPALDALK